MMDVDASRFLTYEAAWKFGEGLQCAKEIAMAKGWTVKLISGSLPPVNRF